MSGPTRRPRSGHAGSGAGRAPTPITGPGSGPGAAPGPAPARRGIDRNPDEKPRPMERLADLLPGAAREFGLEEQLEQARLASAWLSMVAERVPAAAGFCRLVDLNQGIATIEADEPIVAQEVRLRTPELLAALRATARTPVRQLRVTTRHV